ncbi:hypothetical protein Nepgr_019947 [Nepenthes gracilis]|uniref:Uncharacterized protein n=1 Tax=Nepenthes gracilis TaxID=150966 RepID=A0AAD3XVV6_NEPGR|nr:hypothetical protein Nepgr_019947 [Nepenthes gracilis]
MLGGLVSDQRGWRRGSREIPEKAFFSDTVAQRFNWRVFVPCCGILEEPTVPKPTRQNSFQRLALADLCNPNSGTLSEDLSNSLLGSNLHAFSLAELSLIT